MTDAVEPTAGATVAAPAPLVIPVLELRHVNAAYGPFRALFDVSLAVGEGETVALLGRNGAGKTTVARVASGLVEPTEGEVMVDGNDFTKARAHRYAKAGVVHVPEGRAVFSDFTVEENLTLAFSRTPRPHRRARRPQPGLRSVPSHRPAPPPDRRHPVGRRTAHAGHGPGAGGDPSAAHRR